MGIESKPIDARALWERIGDVVGKGELSMDILYEELKAAPALPVVPDVQAKWWAVTMPGEDQPRYMCTWCDNLVKVRTQYCSGCGAKMDLK